MRYRGLLACCGMFTGAVLALSAALTTLAAAPGHSQDPAYGKMRLECNVKASSLHIADASAAPALKPGPVTTTTIVWGALIRMAQKNQRGESLRLGSSTSHYRCGQYEVRVSGGYLNPRPTGEGGAIEFPVVEIRHGKDVIVPRTAIAECEEALPRYEHFGSCAKAWAQSVTVTWNPATSKSQVAIQRAYVDKALNERTSTDTFEVAAGAKP